MIERGSKKERVRKRGWLGGRKGRVEKIRERGKGGRRERERGKIGKRVGDKGRTERGMHKNIREIWGETKEGEEFFYILLINVGDPSLSTISSLRQWIDIEIY